MKKLFCLLLALAMTLCLAACGGSEGATPNPSTPNNNQGAVSGDNAGTETDPGYTFTYNGTKITMNVDAAPIIAALGESKRYTEEASCAFSGLDKTYDYGSFYLQTYPNGDKDYVYGVWFADDGVSTEEGVYIGMEQADVEKAYGAESYNGENAYILTKGICKLTVIITDGVVSSVQYDALVS